MTHSPGRSRIDSCMSESRGRRRPTPLDGRGRTAFSPRCSEATPLINIDRVVIQYKLRANRLRATSEVAHIPTLYRHTLDTIDRCGPERESRTVVLTHPRIKDVTSANWEANITRKNSVESSTMVARTTETLTPVVFNFAADEMINAKARTSNSYTVAIGSMRRVDLPTHHKRGKNQRT